MSTSESAIEDGNLSDQKIFVKKAMGRFVLDTASSGENESLSPRTTLHPMQHELYRKINYNACKDEDTTKDEEWDESAITDDDDDSDRADSVTGDSPSIVTLRGMSIIGRAGRYLLGESSSFCI